MSRSKWVVIVVAVCVLAAVAAIAYAAGQAKVSAAVAIAYAAGQAKVLAPEVIRAQKFELVDAQGTERGALWMGLFGDTPSLWLYDEKGDPHAGLSVHPDGHTSLALHDEKGHLSALLSAVSWGGSHLTLYDKEGQGRAKLGATTLESTPTAGVEKRPESSLVLFNPALGEGCQTPEDWELAQGEVIWSAP